MIIPASDHATLYVEPSGVSFNPPQKLAVLFELPEFDSQDSCGTGNRILWIAL